MAQEMRIFVSLIVWLFYVTGADGVITTKMQNFVILKGYGAVLECATDESYMNWRYQNYIDPTEDGEEKDAVDSDCFSVAAFVSSRQRRAVKGYACDLIAFDTEKDATFKYFCTDVRSTFHAIVMVLQSNLKCGIEDNKYSCKMANSAYFNKSTMNTPYISSRLVWKDASGTVVSRQDSDFQTPGTVVTTAVPVGVSSDHPYVCSAEFDLILEGESKEEFSPFLNIIPYDKFECKFPLTEEHVEEAHEAASAASAAAAAATAGAAGAPAAPRATAAAAATAATAAEEAAAAAAAARDESKAKETAARKKASSNANLERDGVDAIAMMLSLMAAFLVH